MPSPSHSPSVTRAAELPAALTAFLRGAERRAFVFLWLQGGDAAMAEKALAAAIRAFPGPAANLPMAEWPDRFWRLLLALPVEPSAPSRAWPASVAFLADLPLPVRRALLLRQVAGLDEAAAAAALGVHGDAYQQALAEACPRDASGMPDPGGWRRQAEAIQLAGRELDPPQLLRLAQLREAALAGRMPGVAPDRQAAAAEAPPAPPSTRPGAPAPRRGRARLVLFAVLAILAVLAGVMTLRFWPGWAGSDLPAATDTAQAVDDLRVHDNEPVVVEELPPADVAAQPADGPLPLPEPLPDPVIAELALLSWQAAGAPATRIEREQGEVAAAGMPASVATPGIDDATLLQAWRQLDASEQARVHAAATALRVQDPASQARLRADFAALDAMERRGWLLGPALGADFFALQPLLGFVPEDEREPLLAALRALAPEQRALLGEMARRTPPAGREALRRELLATAPASRSAWLEQRSRQ